MAHARTTLTFPAFGIGEVANAKSPGTFVICGGGGSSRSGVKNYVNTVKVLTGAKPQPPVLSVCLDAIVAAAAAARVGGTR